MPTTQLTPVGVGWGDYVIAWLLTYNGADCALWRYVYSKCMESELCRRLIDLLPTIGYRLEMHKCYADLDAEIEVEAELRHIEADQALRQSNLTSASKPTTKTKASHPKTTQKLKTLKPSK
jgi:hypothetical protein